MLILRHTFRVATVISGFIVFHLGAAILGWIVLPLLRLVSFNTSRGRARCQRVVSWTFRLMMNYLDLIGAIHSRVETQDGAALDQVNLERPSVVIANHPTILDVVLLMSVIGEGVIVVNSWVYFNPFWGTLPWCCGYIHARPGLGSGVDVIRQAIDRLEKGSHVVLFPEGTRSPRHGLWPFKKGAFRIAEETRADLVPFCVVCDPPVLGKKQSIQDFPANENVQLVATQMPVEHNDHSSEGAREKASRFENHFIEYMRNRGALKAA